MSRLQILLCSFVLIASSGVYAQQLPLFTQYREFQTILNPAAVSSIYLINNQNLTFGASYRDQWSGFAANPTTATLRGDFIYENDGVSLLTGGHLIHDQTGPTSNTGVYGRIGGVISRDPAFEGISIGLTAGLVQYRVNGDEITLREGGDILDGQSDRQLAPDVGFGVYAYKNIFRDHYIYGGFSVPQLLGLDLSFDNQNGEYSTKRIQHYYALAGYIYKFKDDSFLEPTVWAKYVDGTKVNVDVNVRYRMQNKFWIGIGGATAQAMHAEAGVILDGYDNMLQIGYGFDYSFTSFGPFTGASHEISIAYSLQR